jgi:2-polyprenyl-3-methyl-5-hydroxy-6-metoxy-1,4-benzoquinol methylase
MMHHTNPSPDPVERYYNSYWADGVAGWHPAAAMPKPLASLLTKSAHGRTVLDFGGGDGLRYGDILRAAAGSYTVSDISTSILELRSSRGDATVHASVLEGQCQTYDLIVALEVLEHLLDPEATLTLLARNLAPTGVLLLSVPNAFSLVNRLRMLRGRLPASGVGGNGVREQTYRAPHIRFFDLASLFTLVKRAGLGVNEVFGDGIDAWRFSARLPYRLVRYRAHLRLPFELLASGYVVSCSLTCSAVNPR